MKQIRSGVFETNSSSTHSLVICTYDEFKKFIDGELIYDRYAERLVEKSIAKDANGVVRRFNTYDNLGETSWGCYDTYEHHFTTPSGDKMVAFGTYGRD